MAGYARAVHGSADDASPRGLLDRKRLSADHRLVHRTTAVDHHAVHRDLLARAHPQSVPDVDVRQGDIALPSVIDETSGALRVVETEPDIETRRILHRTIDGVRSDMEALRFNTAIAKLIECNNHLTTVSAASGTPRAVAEPFVLLLAPLAPHMAEELWSRLGHDGSVAAMALPDADPAMLVDDTIEVPVQVNGKVRARITVAVDAADDDITAAALAEANVQAHLDGRAPKKLIVVRGRMVNIVV